MAEYHIYDGPRIMGQTFPSKEFQAEFFRFMSETFKSTPWSVSIDAASSEYTPLEADASLRNLKFGVFDDSFVHETHDEYNGKNWKIWEKNDIRLRPQEVSSAIIRNMIRNMYWIIPTVYMAGISKVSPNGFT